MASSRDRAFGSFTLRTALLDAREPPKKSLCRSYAAARYSGPFSYFAPMATRYAFSDAVLSSSGEYWTPKLTPAHSGDSYFTELPRRRWKLAALVSDRFDLDRTLLIETKFPEPMPRKPSVSP